MWVRKAERPVVGVLERVVVVVEERGLFILALSQNAELGAFAVDCSMTKRDV